MWAGTVSLWTTVSRREVGGGMKRESPGCDRRKCEFKHSCLLRDSCRIISVIVLGWDEKRGVPLPLTSASPKSYGVWSMSSLVNIGLKVSPTLESLKTREMHYKSKISREKYIFMSPCLLNTCREQYSMTILTSVQMLPIFDSRNFILIASHALPLEWSLNTSYL